MHSLKQRGFTLLELLVVVSIIGVLALLTIGSLQNSRRKSNDAKRKTDVKSIQLGLESYYADYNVYPGNTTWQTDLAPIYIPNIPKDPLCTTACPTDWTDYEYAQACNITPAPCDVTQGYSLTATLENQNDPDGLIAGPPRQYKVCGGSNGNATSCSTS